MNICYKRDFTRDWKKTDSHIETKKILFNLITENNYKDRLGIIILRSLLRLYFFKWGLEEKNTF